MFDPIPLPSSLEEVVQNINASYKDESSTCSVRTDIREPEEIAGEYAWDAAEENGYTEEDDIRAHLEILINAGADFDYFKALENALQRKGNQMPFKKIKPLPGESMSTIQNGRYKEVYLQERAFFAFLTDPNYELKVSDFYPSFGKHGFILYFVSKQNVLSTIKLVTQKNEQRIFKSLDSLRRTVLKNLDGSHGASLIEAKISFFWRL
jgi:hypothetical protein